MAAPQSVVTVSQRAARALIGWMAPNEAALAMVGRQMNVTASPEQVERARRAREIVAARRPGVDQSGLTQPIPPELADHEAQLRRSPAAAQLFAEGWRIGLADLRKTCSFQPLVFTENADERTAGLEPTDIRSIARVSLPVPGPTPLPTQFDPVKNAFLFSSTNLNLRVAGNFSGEVAPGAVGFGFIVGVSPSFMQVAYFHGRHFLRDGYHRAYSLLRRGIHNVPVFLREFGPTEEPGVPGGMLPQGAYLGDRPPLLIDYLDDDVSAEVRAPAAHKMVIIQALELTPLG